MSANFYTGLTDEQLQYEFTLDKRSFKEAGVLDYAPELKDRTAAELFKVGEWYHNKRHKFGYNKALEWLFKADILGDMRASYLIGQIYFESGTPVDYDYAFKSFKKCATADYNLYTHDSEFILGEMYAEGKGTKKDMETALIWYTKAASRNHQDAQLRAGLIYASNPSDLESVKKAYFWLSNLARNNNEEAMKALEKLKKEVGYEIGELVRKDNPYPSLAHMLNENSEPTPLQEANREKEGDPIDQAKNKEQSKNTTDNKLTDGHEGLDAINNALNKSNTLGNLGESVKKPDIQGKRKMTDVDEPPYGQIGSKRIRNDTTNNSNDLSGSVRENSSIQNSAHKQAYDKDEFARLKNNSIEEERAESSSTKNFAAKNGQKNTNNIDINNPLVRKTIIEGLEIANAKSLSIDQRTEKPVESLIGQDYISLDEIPNTANESTSNTHSESSLPSSRDIFSAILSDISRNEEILKKLEKQRTRVGKRKTKLSKAKKTYQSLSSELEQLEALFYHIANNPVNNFNLSMN